MPTKAENNLEDRLTSWPTSRTERPRAPALAFERDNIPAKVLGEKLTELDRGQAQK